MPDTYDPAAFAAYLDGRVLLKGHHDGTGSVDACALEHVAAFMGEPWSDKPACASTVPSVFVWAVGWSPTWPEGTSDEVREFWDSVNYGPEDGYFKFYGIEKYLHDEPFEAEDDDEAREECHGNW